jgi:hypothetical protein
VIPEGIAGRKKQTGIVAASASGAIAGRGSALVFRVPQKVSNNEQPFPLVYATLKSNPGLCAQSHVRMLDHS